MAERGRSIQPVINFSVQFTREGDHGQEIKVKEIEIGRVVIPSTSNESGLVINMGAQAAQSATRCVQANDYGSNLQRLELPDTYRENYFAEEQASLLIYESKYRDAAVILEKLPLTQRQQMMLFECYCQLEEKEQASSCIETLQILVTSSPFQSRAEDVFELGMKIMTIGHNIRALSVFSCASRLYSLNPNAVGALEGLRLCGHQTVVILRKIFEEKKSECKIIWDVGIDLVRNNHLVVSILNVVDIDKKVDTEAHCLNQLGFVFYLLGKDGMSLQLYKNAYEMMRNHFGSKATEHRVYGHLLHNIGDVYKDLKNYRDSIFWFEIAFKTYDTILDWRDEKQKKDAVLRTEKNLSFVRQQLDFALTTN